MKPPPRYSAAFSITRFAIFPSSRFRNSLIADMRNFAAWGSFLKPPESEVLAPASRQQFFSPNSHPDFRRDADGTCCLPSLLLFRAFQVPLPDSHHASASSLLRQALPS